MWVAPCNLGDPAVLAAGAAARRLRCRGASGAGRRPRGQGRLVANTEEAVARGVFGAPTCFVGEQMFFGQDRLDFVREALA